jgi:CubicO group peptidase (beta-lactamase class C family)
MKHAIRYGLIASFLLIALEAVSAQGNKPAIDNYIEEQMAKLHLPGTAMAILRDGKIELIKGYGLANIERKIAITPDSMFQIGSSTKPYSYGSHDACRRRQGVARGKGY